MFSDYWPIHLEAARPKFYSGRVRKFSKGAASFRIFDGGMMLYANVIRFFVC